MTKLRIAGLAFVASVMLFFIVATQVVGSGFNGIGQMIGWLASPFGILGLPVPAANMQPAPTLNPLLPTLCFLLPIVSLNSFWWFIRELAKRYDNRIS